MSYHDIDYDDDDAEEESEVTFQSAREELEYWTEIFQEQKDEKPEEWMFYRNPFLDPSIYAYWLLTDEKKGTHSSLNIDKAILLLTILVSPLFVKEI